MTTVRRSLAWSFLQNNLAAAIAFGSSIILARLLTPSEIGVYSLCAAFIGIGNVLRDLGIGEYLIQERELTRDRVRAAMGITLAMGIAMAAGLNAASGLIADFYREPGLQLLIAVLSVNFLVIPFATPVNALLARAMVFRAIFAIQTCSTVTAATVSVILAWRGLGYMSLAWGSVAGSLVTLFVSTFWRPPEAWVLPGLRAWRRVIGFGTFSTGANMLAYLYGTAQDFVIGRLMGFHSLGILGRGTSLLNAFNQALLPPVIRVALPALAAQHRAGQGLCAQYAKSVSIMSVVAFPFFGFVGLLAFPLVRVLFGPQWDESIPILRIAAIGFGIGSMCAFAPTVLTSLGQVRTKFIIQVISLLVYVPILAALGFVSLQAVAIGMVISGLVPFLLYSQAMRRAIGFDWSALALTLRKSAMVGGLVLLGPAILVTMTDLSRASPLVALIVAGLWSTLVWIVAVWATRHPITEELDGAWSHIRGIWHPSR